MCQFIIRFVYICVFFLDERCMGTRERMHTKEGTDVWRLVDVRILSGCFWRQEGTLGALFFWMVLATREYSFYMLRHLFLAFHWRK